jgi:hypothetical protein
MKKYMAVINSNSNVSTFHVGISLESFEPEPMIDS